MFEDLTKYGFNYYGTANNHCMDYSYHGMLSTISELDKRGLARSCIDAGVSAVIGGGAHQLRPIEIYKGCPIFYSLGDFIYQGMRVPYLPADFMEKYGCDKNATALEGLMARSKNNTIGLQVHKHNFMTVLPKMEFEDGKLVSLEMMPVVAGFKREGKLDGLPYYAKGEEAKEIFDVLDRLSAPYGTKIVRNGDMFKIEI